MTMVIQIDELGGTVKKSAEMIKRRTKSHLCQATLQSLGTNKVSISSKEENIYVISN